MVALCMFVSFIEGGVLTIFVLLRSALIWIMPAPGSAKYVSPLPGLRSMAKPPWDAFKTSGTCASAGRWLEV